MRTLSRISLCVIIVLSLYSCGYTSNFIKQIKFTRKQNKTPSQNTQKQMLENETFLVMGKTIDEAGRYSEYSTTVAAYSNMYIENELVDIMHYSGVGTHFGLYLPGGVYDLVVFADKDRNQVLDENEVVGRTRVTLTKEFSPDMVFDGVAIELNNDAEIDWDVNIAMPETKELEKSLFYPEGTIRTLDDPIFDEKVTVLGMYHPAEFLDQAHTMFYALEEDLGHKIPVIFVHGFGGSSRAFKLMVEQLDRNRFKPWFFYYPSGADLDQMSEFFYIDDFLLSKRF